MYYMIRFICRSLQYAYIYICTIYIVHTYIYIYVDKQIRNEIRLHNFGKQQPRRTVSWMMFSIHFSLVFF